MIIKKIEKKEREWVLDIVRGWGADFIYVKKRKIFPSEGDGFVAYEKSGTKIGLITFTMENGECEITLLEAFDKFKGTGTSLIQKVILEATLKQCNRIWLITTNDNIDAIRFYQKRGFRLKAIYRDAAEETRKYKPSLPSIGVYGIPLRDELEFEMEL